MPSGVSCFSGARSWGAWTGHGSPPMDRWAKRWASRPSPPTRSDPTQRTRIKGVKRSVVVESNSDPLGVTIAGANVHDTQLLAATLDAIVLAPPFPTEEQPLHLCLDKAYDNPTGAQAIADSGYIGRVRRIGEEKLDDHGEKTHPARRWVVERTMAWLAKYRSIRVRYEVKP
ncbi:transposase, partial [Candidatus Poribacteria bacterium]|nr:transposase [Candidatus Poribacteria bacterium]